MTEGRTDPFIEILKIIENFLPFHGGIPVVLDGVVRSSRQILGYFRPAIPHFLVQHVNLSVFFLRPSALLDVGIEMIVPSGCEKGKEFE